MNETQRINQTIKTEEFTAHDVACWFLEQNSDEQAWFLNYLLTFLHNSCGGDYNGDMQFAYIAAAARKEEKHLRLRHLANLIETSQL